MLCYYCLLLLLFFMCFEPYCHKIVFKLLLCNIYLVEICALGSIF